MARNALRRPERYCIRLSRVLTSAALAPGRVTPCGPALPEPGLLAISLFVDVASGLSGHVLAALDDDGQGVARRLARRLGVRHVCVRGGRGASGGRPALAARGGGGARGLA